MSVDEAQLGTFPVLERITRWTFVLGIFWASYAIGYIDGLTGTAPWSADYSIQAVGSTPAFVWVLFTAGGFFIMVAGGMQVILSD